MADPKLGDYVEIATNDEVFAGVLLESPELDRDMIIVKLEGGYNVGLDRRKVKKISFLRSPEKETLIKPQARPERKNLPKISILHTGGTIASKVDYRTGGVASRFKPEEILAMFPELKEIANFESRLIANTFSEDVRFAHYNVMAREIAKEIKRNADGIIVTHGTDTMHYTSAALSFMLENLPVPVILVGSQRSSDRGSSDSALNLLSAAYFIANSEFTGVGICMHENLSDNSCLILPGTKTRKMHTSRRDAFRAINAAPIARVNFGEKNVSLIAEPQEKPKGNLKLRPIKDDLKIGILKARPNLFADEIKSYSKFDGLIIEGTGLGQLSVTHFDEHTGENARILAELESLARKIPVVMTSQAIHGRVQMNVYSTGRNLQKAGIIGHLNDLTPETAFIKLAWLLSNYDIKESKEMMTQNLRGEISKRTEERFF